MHCAFDTLVPDFLEDLAGVLEAGLSFLKPSSTAVCQPDFIVYNRQVDQVIGNLDLIGVQRLKAFPSPFLARQRVREVSLIAFQFTEINQARPWRARSSTASERFWSSGSMTASPSS